MALLLCSWAQEQFGCCGSARPSRMSMPYCLQNPACRQLPSQLGPIQSQQPRLENRNPFGKGLALGTKSLSWHQAGQGAAQHSGSGAASAVPRTATSAALEGQLSPTQAAVSVVHQEVSAKGPGRVVVHAARAVRHVTHHHRLCIREPVGKHNSEGHGWLPSPQPRPVPQPCDMLLPGDSVLPPSPSPRAKEDEYWLLSEMST